MDLHVVAGLMHMATNALYYIDMPQAGMLAISYIMVAEATIEACGAQNSEVWKKNEEKSENSDGFSKYIAALYGGESSALVADWPTF